MCCFSLCTAVHRCYWLLETAEDMQQHALLVIGCFDLWAVFVNFNSLVQTEVVGQKKAPLAYATV